ncbi:MAG: glycosyltransferase family 4 protein [Solirubrobacteraceae bacterium]|nr:glycosyltransferase family 4 protein [Solirubrobacteraceae bacterium]
MNVAFLVNDLQLSGGVGVVVEHARQLPRHGIEAALVLAREREDPDWRFRGLGEVEVLSLAQARERRFDVALATWWATTEPLFELPARRRAYFVQSLEDRFYRPDDPQRLGAALTHDLPVDVVTEARWIAETLEELRPDLRALLVRNGVAKDVFTPPAELDVRLHGPLRIVIEGNPHVWFKGVPEALAAVREMREPRHVTLVTGARDVDTTGADEVVGPLTHEEMAALYARSDVVLKLSRVEGMFGPPLEGFHLGATCVVTAVTGHEEYVEHGVNGLVVDWDDPRGTSRALDLLARDRALLHHLRCGALATARAWPSWEQAGTVMAAALREIARRPEPAAAPGAARAIADVRAAVEAQALVVAERDRLRYRVKPLERLDRVVERAPLRWLLAPLRRVWRRVRPT